MSSSSRENNSIYRSVIENNRDTGERSHGRKNSWNVFPFFLFVFLLAKHCTQYFLRYFLYYWDSNFYCRIARFICSSNFVFFFFNPNTYYLSFERAFCMSKLFIARINLLIVRAQMWHVSIATIVRVLPYSFVKKLKLPEKFSVKVLVRLESILILNNF